jgi:tellurite resistance-related uncharacterized protein
MMFGLCPSRVKRINNVLKAILRRCARPLLWLLSTLLILFGLQITLLAFPQLLFSESFQAGTVVVHHDGLPAKHAERLAITIDRRLQGSRFHDATRNDPVFVFRERGAYALYRKLLFSNITPSGFNLPVFGNSYVCEAIVTELGTATGGQPRFSIWDGDVAHIAAHEIGHQLVVDRIGSGRWREMPHWKQEGLPEYIANIGDIRADPAAHLSHRIEILNDDTLWTATPSRRWW